MSPPGIEDTIGYQFAELATRPLDDRPKLREKARTELMSRLIFVDEEFLVAPLQKLAESQPKPWKKTGRMAALAMLLLAILGVWMAHSLWRSWKDAPAQWAAISTARPSPPENRAAITDPGEYEDWLVRKPPLLAELPADYRAVHERLDPGNGAWAWREAVYRARKDEQLWRGSIQGIRQDSAALKEAWRLVEEAVRAPRFEFREPARRAKRLAAHEPPANFAELSVRTTPLAGIREKSLLRFLYFRKVDERDFYGGRGDDVGSSLIAYYAKDLEEAGDKEGLCRAIGVWESLCPRLAADASNYQDLQSATQVVGAGWYFLKATEKLGMSAEAARINKQLGSSMSALPYLRGPVLDCGMGEPITRPPLGVMSMPALTSYRVDVPLYRADMPIFHEAYTPGRMAEYAATEQPLVLAALLPVLLVLGMARSEAVRRGPRINGMADGLLSLFDRQDWRWIIGLGVLAPFAWYWGITRFTPLGCRQIGLMHFDYPPMVLQIIASLMLLLILVIQTGRWRIARRCGMLGLGPRTMPRLGWLAAGATAAVVPLAGLVAFFRLDSAQAVLLIASGIPLFLLLCCGGGYLFAPKSQSLEGALLGRLVVPPLLAAAGLLLLSNLLLVGAGKFWLAVDPITGWDAKRGCNYLEAACVDAYAVKVREQFAPPP